MSARAEGDASTRVSFTLTDDEYAQIAAAMQPMPHVMIGGEWMPSAQDRVNDLWQTVCASRGLDRRTVSAGSGTREFTAVP